jgi:cytidylate kinase
VLLITNYFDKLSKYANTLIKTSEPKGVIIAVAGLAASGKTTGAKALAQALGLEYYSVGSIFREKAKEMGISIEQFSKIRSHELDLEADKKALEIMMKGNVVVEGRVVGILASLLKPLEKSGKVAIVRILYQPPLKVRASRYAQKEGKPYEISVEMVRIRDEADVRKYSALYGIDITDPKFYDIIFDNSEWSLEDAQRLPILHVISYLQKNNLTHLLKFKPSEGLKRLGCPAS